MAGYGSIPQLQNPALGQSKGGLEREVTNAISGRMGNPKVTQMLDAVNQQQGAPAQQQQQQASLFSQQAPLSMDWRARAADLMRRRMAKRSNEQGAPAWMKRGA